MHMVHTLEQIRTRTPTSPNDVVPEAAMPQAAQEALLWDAVQGFRPPKQPRNPPPVAPDHPAPDMGDRRPTAPPPTPPPSHGEQKWQGQGKGKRRESIRQQGGEERPKVAGRRPQGQGTGGDTRWVQKTINEPGRGRSRGRGKQG